MRPPGEDDTSNAPCVDKGGALIRRLFNQKPSRAQLELDIQKSWEPDRNFHKGGRSFYFFDFDDNVAFLSTPVFIFHKDTGRELELSSREFAQQSGSIGKRGPYAEYAISYCDESGTFRSFRDVDIHWLQKVLGRRQPFIDDLGRALGFAEFHWKGPSWSCFYHAVFNGRPVSLITARGHSPGTLKEGVRLMVKRRYLPHEPNYLSLFPVSHPEIKNELKMPRDASIPELKKAAIRASVEVAIQRYGYNEHHRFGMSDDDPANVQLITEEMIALKKIHPEMGFFVIETSGGRMVKREIFADHFESHLMDDKEQMSLFEKNT